MNVTIFTRFWMCCLLFAASVVNSFAADRLLIVGDAVWGGWSLDNAVIMSAGENDVWKATTHLEANKDFKFFTTSSFGGLEYRAESANLILADNEPAKLVSVEGDDDDYKFIVSESANYDIVCDLANKTITVSKAAYQDNAIKYNALWMVGDATPNGWRLDNAVLMSQDETLPAVYTATVDLQEGEFKVAVNKYSDFNQLFYKRDAADATKVVLNKDVNADNKWKIAEAGNYTVKLNVADMTISIVKNTSTEISSVEAEDANISVEYFTLEGKRVNNISDKGLYIKRQGGKSVKVMVSK